MSLELEGNDRIIVRVVKAELGLLRVDMTRMFTELVAENRERKAENSAVRGTVHQIEVEHARHEERFSQVRTNSSDIKDLDDEVVDLGKSVEANTTRTRNWNIAAMITAASAAVTSFLSGGN